MGSIESSATEFIDDDGSYTSWLESHPNGFVVNTRRAMPTNYMVLHRASCPSVSQYTEIAKEGGFTERQYVKVCGETIEALRDWVREHGGTDFSGECPMCKP